MSHSFCISSKRLHLQKKSNRMTKIIAISNFKGGVGKTTSTMNIGASLAQMGKRVLLVDLDPQFNLTRCLGVKSPQNIYGALFNQYPTPIVHRAQNLDLLPSDLELIRAETELVSQYRREEKLNSILKANLANYDYALIDCPPSLGVLSQMAFFSADIILVPIQAEFLALTGYSVLVRALDAIGIEIDGAFVTQYDKRQVLDRNMFESMQNIIGEKLFKTVIRQNVALAESTIQGKTIFEYSPLSNGATDYKNLSSEILLKFN
jgi:chromosome partitioning protein